jgi:hypothetical protein
MTRGIIPALLMMAVGGGVSAGEGCPPAAVMLERLESVDLSLGARTARFGAEPPRELYSEAIRDVGVPVVGRRGKQGHGVLVVELPAMDFWKAINDEDHQALDGGYVPVGHSEVIGGVPRGSSRLLFQYYQQWGVGRWWVSRVRINPELYAKSDGRMWEVTWEDEIDGVDPSVPPMSLVSSKIDRLDASRGAWLLVPLADRCTLVEHFSWTEPGGVAGALAPMRIKSALRQTLLGLERMAREHIPLSDPDHRFVGPDGNELP